jgi:hypothetical protein
VLARRAALAGARPALRSKKPTRALDTRNSQKSPARKPRTPPRPARAWRSGTRHDRCVSLRKISATQCDISATRRDRSVSLRHISAARRHISGTRRDRSVSLRKISGTRRDRSVNLRHISATQCDISATRRDRSVSLRKISAAQRHISATRRDRCVSLRKISGTRRDRSVSLRRWLKNSLEVGGDRLSFARPRRLALNSRMSGLDQYETTFMHCFEGAVFQHAKNNTEREHVPATGVEIPRHRGTTAALSTEGSRLALDVEHECMA